MLHLLFQKGPGNGQVKLKKNGKLVDGASDGLIFMDIDVVECFDYDLVL